MRTKTVVAVIGSTGNMGAAIAKSLAKGNNRLLLFGRDEDKIKALEAEIQANEGDAEVVSMGCPIEASWEADVVILALPYQAEAEVVQKIKPFVTKKIVVSIANPLNATYDGLVTAPDTSAAEELQKLLPDSFVVKAFNTTFAADFAQPVIDGKQVDAFVAGDNEPSVQKVVELVETAGFNPIVAGKLAVSRTLENMQSLLIQLNMKYDYGWHAGWKILNNSVKKD